MHSYPVEDDLLQVLLAFDPLVDAVNEIRLPRRGKQQGYLFQLYDLISMRVELVVLIDGIDLGPAERVVPECLIQRILLYF